MTMQISSFVFALGIFASCSTPETKDLSRLASEPGRAQIERFDGWLKELQKAYDPKEAVSEVAADLSSDQSRKAAFYLQALGKVYESKGKLFRKVHEDFKKLEDLIGEQDKFAGKLRAAEKRGASKDQIAALKNSIKSSKKKLEKYLEKNQWVGKGDRYLPKLRAQIADYDWGDYGDDKDFILPGLVKQVEKVEAIRFNLAALEEGNGLHELRRELRWFLFEVKALNGLVQYKEGARCPIPAYGGLTRERIASSSYVKINRGSFEEAPCFVSQCLLLAVADLVEELGIAKDKVESGDSSNDYVAPEIRERSQKLYDNAVKLSLLPALASELKACEER